MCISPFGVSTPMTQNWLADGLIIVTVDKFVNYILRAIGNIPRLHGPFGHELQGFFCRVMENYFPNVFQWMWYICSHGLTFLKKSTYSTDKRLDKLFGLRS
jgi:hypothetical protein